MAILIYPLNWFTSYWYEKKELDPMTDRVSYVAYSDEIETKGFKTYLEIRCYEQDNLFLKFKFDDLEINGYPIDNTETYYLDVRVDENQYHIRKFFYNDMVNFLYLLNFNNSDKLLEEVLNGSNLVLKIPIAKKGEVYFEYSLFGANHQIFKALRKCRNNE